MESNKKNTFLEVMYSRRSIRRYTEDLPSKADLETIVDAGRMAATGSNRQPWDFIVVTNPVMISDLGKARYWVSKAKAVIVVVMDPGSRWWIEDGSAAIENMLLACTALGYGSCWVEGDMLPYEEHFKILLGIPAEKRILALLPVGIPAEAPSVKKKPLNQVLHWEKF